MSLITLLSLDHEVIEVVTGAVSDWCGQQGCDIDSSNGRKAMAAAVQLALSSPPTRSELLQLLSTEIAGQAWFDLSNRPRRSRKRELVRRFGKHL